MKDDAGNPVPYRDIDITEDLSRRAVRPPDYRVEAEAMLRLARAMTLMPEECLQELAAIALHLCGADSSGICVAETEGGENVVRWRAAAGAFAPLVGKTMRRESSVSGVVLDRKAAQLVAEPARTFGDLASLSIPIPELLLVPLDREGTAIGTIGVAAHTIAKRFDAEDLRLLTTIGEFASTALRIRDWGVERNERVGSVHKGLEHERATELRAEQILESITDGFFALDREWRFSYVNPQFERILGKPSAEVLGRVLWDVYPGLIGNDLSRMYHRVADRGISESATVYYPDHDRWYEAHAYPSPDGLAIYFRDVSDRMHVQAERERIAEEAERERRIFQAAISNTPDLIYVFDLSHRFIYANEALLKMWGRTSENALGKDCLELGYEPWHAAMHDREIDQVVATGKSIRGEVPFEGTNGRRIYDYIFVPVFGADGTVQAVAGTTRDVTDRKEAEEALRSKTERLNLFVENTKDYAVIITDPQGTIIEWQGGAERITGYDAVEVIGRNIELIFTEEDRVSGDSAQEMARSAAFGRSEGKRWQLKKDGSRFFADGVLTALYDESGLRGFGKVFKDATGEKATEMATLRRSAQFQRLADVANRINSAHDVRSVLGVVTEEARQLVGGRQSATSMVPEHRQAQPLNVATSPGEGLPDAILPGLEGMQLYEAECLTNEPIRLTRETIELNPKWRRLRSTSGERPTPNGWIAAPLVGRNGKRMGLIQIVDREDGEFTNDDEVILLQLTRLTSIAIENARLYQKLRSNDERKDEFLAMLAHELRNPLAAIGNAIKLTGQTDEKADREWSHDVITRQMKHLSRLIDDLLDVSRITRGKIQLRRDVLEVTPILESAAAAVRTLLDERKHRLELTLDRGHLWVNVDPTRLEQVVVNLLNNAAKYSENGGRILLSVRQEKNRVVISVKDTGVGIPPDKLPEMFELFTQGDRSLARSEGGLGIGLTVVKKLVEMHGGTVTASSPGIGKGCEFVLRLPAADPPSSSMAEAVSRQTDDLRKARILVVDDNVDTARGMARLLKLIGHDVATAHSGPEGIEAARLHRPEFILLDIGLPGMSGYEVAAQLRKEELCKTAVIVAISGYGQDEDRRRSKQAGFDHHLVKPLDHDALLALLARNLND